MTGLRGQQDAEEYCRLTACIRSESEPDMTDFAGLQCFRSGLHRILELSLVDQSSWNVHPPIIANAPPDRVTYRAVPRVRADQRRGIEVLRATTT